MVGNGISEPSTAWSIFSLDLFFFFVKFVKGECEPWMLHFGVPLQKKGPINYCQKIWDAKTTLKGKAAGNGSSLNASIGFFRRFRKETQAERSRSWWLFICHTNIQRTFPKKVTTDLWLRCSLDVYPESPRSGTKWLVTIIPMISQKIPIKKMGKVWSVTDRLFWGLTSFIWAMKKGPLVVSGIQGDEKLARYIGIIINHYKDPVINQPGFNGK